MHRAVERNSLEAVKTLLELGASPNYKDTKGLTPLYYSVIYKTDPMLCETLLHDHATIGAQDLQGWQEVHQVSAAVFDLPERTRVAFGDRCRRCEPGLTLSLPTAVVLASRKVLSTR